MFTIKHVEIEPPRWFAYTRGTLPGEVSIVLRVTARLDKTEYGLEHVIREDAEVPQLPGPSKIGPVPETRVYAKGTDEYDAIVAQAGSAYALGRKELALAFSTGIGMALLESVDPQWT